MSRTAGVARWRDARASLSLSHPRARIVGLIAAAAALALLVAMVTWGGLNKMRQPQLALGAMPTNGFALPQAAVRAAAAQVGDNPGKLTKVSISGAQREAALDGYRREPLASQGLAIAAIAAENHGNAAKARALMGAALELSRRDSLVNGWAVLDASRRNDLEAVIAGLNRSMTTNPAAASIYVPAMVKSLEQGASIAVLARILARRPPWELEFWRAAVVAPQSVGNAGKLRVSLDRRAEEDKEIDRALLAALAARREFATATLLYRAHSDGPRTGPGQIVRNADFAATPVWPPFDWYIMSTGEYGGTIARDGKGLAVEALPGNGGVVARQLVIIPAKPMRLRAALTHSFERDGNRLAIRLQCATTDAQVFEAEFTARTFARDVAPTACRYHWLDVIVRPGIAENREPLALRRIEIIPRAG